MRNCRKITCFLLASLLLSGLIYRDAMWGKSLLAPLDLGPNIFSQYKFMDPSATGIPQNHHIIDQFTYDLPLQYSIYRSYHEGEIPWWDPYTFGGRPLLADAHINGTDPVRLICYAILPFELAYNWNFILRGLITGLGMFLLLLTLRIDCRVSLILALIYQFAGWFTLYFGHPWVQGSFLYFPFLWMVWTSALYGRFFLNLGLGSLLCGLIFYAGNLQSHAYLPIFALALIMAVTIKDRRLFQRALGVTALSGIVGALISFPVLFNQIEFYLVSIRTVQNSGPWYQQLLATPFTLVAFYPWMCGTFRTLDIGRLTHMNGMAFQWFCGIVSSLLSLWGAWALRKEKGRMGVAVCQASLLAAFYLLIVSTPLMKYLYSRCAALAGMGLIILAALALQAILDGKMQPQRWLVKTVLLTVLMIGATTSALAWWVYPSFRPKIEAQVATTERMDTSLTNVPELRKFQIANFPAEVSVANPECCITLLAALILGTALLAKERNEVRMRLLIALVLSALPVFLFHMRFRPRQPIELWHKLVAGGPSQQQAMGDLTGGLRLDESAVSPSDTIFPMDLPALYRIHAIQGYSALQPLSLFKYPSNAMPVPPDWKSDRRSTSTAKNAIALLGVDGTHPSRFRSPLSNNASLVKVIQESNNRILLDASSLPDYEGLISTDTYYPGWVARNRKSPLKIERLEPCFSTIHSFDNSPLGIIELNYIPRSLGIGLPLAITGFLISLGLISSVFIRQKKPCFELS